MGETAGDPWLEVRDCARRNTFASRGIEADPLAGGECNVSCRNSSDGVRPLSVSSAAKLPLRCAPSESWWLA
jgi:hypothetical protein